MRLIILVIPERCRFPGQMLLRKLREVIMLPRDWKKIWFHQSEFSSAMVTSAMVTEGIFKSSIAIKLPILSTSMFHRSEYLFPVDFALQHFK